MLKSRHRDQAGFAMSELMLALIIMVIATTVLIGHLALTYRSSRSLRDRVFGFMVAKSILSEVHAFATVGEGEGTNDIDSFDDGVTPNPILTTATDSLGNKLAPTHELSGNYQQQGDWVWSRLISVRPLPGMDNRKLRYVSVRVMKRENGKTREIANLSAIVNSLAHNYPSSQVFDFYFIAIENVPGWWVHMEAIRPFMEAMVTDLERSNPGLTIRSHWITKASYGRNKVYRPYINANVDSHSESPGVYYYPGLMPLGESTSYYYVPGMMNARMATDLGEINGYDADRNPFPYSLADFFNHGMRYPQEKAYHDLRMQAVRDRKREIADALEMALPPPPELWDMSEEPTYRLLLEDMCTDPTKYANALVVNLHGELLPMPSIRNYSDPAKSPGVMPQVRVVTHPEELRTHRDPIGTAHDDAVFRVYAWVTDPDVYAGPTTLPWPNVLALEVPGVDLTDGDDGLLSGVTLECLRGGVSVDGTSDYFDFTAAKEWDDAGLLTNEMCYRTWLRDPGAGLPKSTRILLYNTPVIAPAVINSGTGEFQGVANSQVARLYDMEYIPACTESALDYSNNLASDGIGPKNTARWRLRIPGTVLDNNRFIDSTGTYYNPPDDVRLTVRTEIRDDTVNWETVGTLYPTPNAPDNKSETYTWWADSREDVPYSERSQFLGDPRYNPYKDLYSGDPDFPDGYNWFFDSLQNGSNAAADYPGLDQSLLANRWKGRVRQDAGRYFELIREGLMRSSAVYTSLTGWSYYYMGHGAEIGYDANNGYPNSIPTILTPFGSAGSTGYVNNITGSRRYVRGDGGAGTYWLGMPWLGELYPDSHYATQWMALDVEGKVTGNLAPGTSTDQFYQEQDNAAYANSRHVTAGTSLLSAHQKLSSEGCGMFMNTGNSSSTFNHTGTGSGTGSLTGPGVELGDNYNFDLPSTTSITRPFSLATSNSPDGWDNPPYSSNRSLASLVRTYYSSTSGGFTGSGVVEIMPPDSSSSAYLVVNGLAQTTELGTSSIAKYSLLSLVHTYYEAADTTLTNPIGVVPRVELVYPTEVTELLSPTTIQIKYDIEWRRWDGEKYTGSTPTGFVGPEANIDYVLMYSRDVGRTWLHVTDDSPAQPGVRPSNPAVFLDDVTTPGQETYDWPTAAIDFPRGSYLVRVEAYRPNQSLHYSFHQKKIFIDR